MVFSCWIVENTLLQTQVKTSILWPRAAGRGKLDFQCAALFSIGAASLIVGSRMQFCGANAVPSQRRFPGPRRQIWESGYPPSRGNIRAVDPEVGKEAFTPSFPKIGG